MTSILSWDCIDTQSKPKLGKSVIYQTREESLQKSVPIPFYKLDNCFPLIGIEIFYFKRLNLNHIHLVKRQLHIFCHQNTSARHGKVKVDVPDFGRLALIGQKVDGARVGTYPNNGCEGYYPNANRDWSKAEREFDLNYWRVWTLSQSKLRSI